MDTLEVLKKTQEIVNFLLRYVVAGGSAVLAFGLTQQDPFSFLRVGTELSALLLLLFVFVIGPAIYSIHRAALHPLILIPIFILLRWRYELTNKWWHWWELDNALAPQKETWRIAGNKWLSTYEGWAAQVHFLYCSAFGTGLALGLAYWFSSNAQHVKHVKAILTVGLILFIAGLVNDWRLTRSEIQRAIIDQVLKKKPAKTSN